MSLGLAELVSLAKLLWGCVEIPPGVLMFYSPARSSMARPHFVTRILIRPFAQRLQIVPLMLSFLPLMGFALLSASAWGQAINCPSGFASSGACGVSFIGSGGQPWAVVGSNAGTTPGLSGSSVQLIPVPPGGHLALSMIYGTPVKRTGLHSNLHFHGERS